MAEAMINRRGGSRLRAYSAGSQPKAVPNPIGLSLLRERGYDVSQYRSKSWNEFSQPDAPQMDVVITVCDAAAGETCPYWPGTPVVAHWGIPDPADDHGSADKNRAAFEVAYGRLAARVTAMLALPIETLTAAVLTKKLAEIGRLEGATDQTNPRAVR